MPNKLAQLFSLASGDLHVPVIAEIAWAHDGQMDLARVIIDGAAHSGADVVNFHVTHLPDYMTPFYGRGAGRGIVSGGQEVGDVYQYLEELNLTFDEQAELIAYARKCGLIVGLMPNDFPSLKFAADVKADVVTIHPSCIFDEKFVRSAAALRTALMLYTGGLMLGEIDKVINWAATEGNAQLILQYGFQTYPTPIQANRLSYIGTLKRTFGRPVSFADHTDGADPMAMIIPLLSIAAGADLVEKHVTHDRAKKGEDFEAALDPAGMSVFVKQLRLATKAMGSPLVASLNDAELKYRSVVRKRAVLAKAASKGMPLTRELISYRRSDAGFYPEELEPLFGKMVIARDAQENAAVDWTLLARNIEF